jgi:hypothetical protein
MRGSFDDPTRLRPVYTAPEACGASEEVELTLTVTNEFDVAVSDSLTVLICDDTCDLPPFSAWDAYPTPSGVTTVAPPGAECLWPPVLPIIPLVEECPPVVEIPECEPVIPDCEPPSPPVRSAGDCAPPAEPAVDRCPPPVQPVVECPPEPEPCPPPPPNCAPTADAGEDITAPQCTRVLLTCDAHDPDGDPLTYLWTIACGGGRFEDPTRLHPTFVTPAVPCGGEEEIVVTLTATDPAGASSSDSMIVRVVDPNRPPTADAGEDITVDECSRVRLTCDGYDPDGDALSYFWTAERGQFVNPAVLHPEYIAPEVHGGGIESDLLTFTVTDRCGLEATDTMTVRVVDGNSPPRVNLGDDLIVLSGSSFRLMPDVVDPDGDLLDYAWSVPAGQGEIDRPAHRAPAFYAPLIPAGTERIVEISLTVSDPEGASACDTLIVRVRNPEPVARP